MASASVTMSLTGKRGVLQGPGSAPLFNPLPTAVRPQKMVSIKPRAKPVKLQVKASLKEKLVTGLTAAALTANVVIPDVAEAAGSGVLTPSLKNFLYSIVAGGVVLTAIIGVVVGVSNFDPVKRG